MTHTSASEPGGLPGDAAAARSGLSRRNLLRGGLLLGGGLAVGGFEVVTAGPAGAAAAASIAGTGEWGAQPPKQAVTVLSSRPTKIIVHHTDSANTLDYSRARGYQLARDIQGWHFANGWIDSGQQFTISRGGYIMEGRHRSLEVLKAGTRHVRGAHTSGQNDVALGIENEGNYTSVGPPQALYDSLVSLCAYMCEQYGIASSAIYGHRDFNSTVCPGDRLYALLPQLRSDVAARVGETTRTWPVVRRGDTGEQVKTVQYLLNQRGHGLVVDGVFGSGTEAAVKSFQTSQALTADGAVGSRTWEKLVVTVRNGSTGDAVRAAQSQLRSKGYSVTVDGVFGAGTESAVRSFQQSRGLTVDGVVGAYTWSYLVVK